MALRTRRTTPLPAIEVVFGAAGTGVELPLDLIPQRGDNWCWAACVEMVDRWRRGGAATTQCRLASTYVTPACCGAPVPSHACDQGLDAALITRVWHENGYSAVQSAAVSIASVDAELRGGSPVQVGLVAGAGGHVVLVVGVNGTSTQYTVLDPIPRDSGTRTTVAAHALMSGLGGAHWQCTWTGLRET